MKRLSKVLAVMLALTLLVSSICMVNVFGASYKDTAGHWAEAVVDKWSSYGIVKGADGYFRPDDNITRAEVAQITQNVIGYVDQAANTFSDVDAGAWYAPAVLKLAAAGTLGGDADGSMRPNDNMKREEAITMLSRAFNIMPEYGYYSNYTDAYEISEYAVYHINNLASHGYINGYADGGIHPKATITRAEFVKIIDNIVGLYITSGGYINDQSISNTAVVKNGGVTFTNFYSNGMIVSPQVTGNVTLKDSNVSAGVTNLSKTANVVINDTPIPVPTLTPTATPQPTARPVNNYYTVDFYNANKVYASRSVRKGGYIDNVPNDPTSVGGSFQGWFTTRKAADSLDYRYYFDTYSDRVQSDMTLYAGFQGIPSPSDNDLSYVSLSTNYPYVGEKITATVYPSAARNSVSYTWYSISASTGPVEVGRGSSYTPSSSDVGFTIKVVAEASYGSGYVGSVSDETSGTVSGSTYYNIYSDTDGNGTISTNPSYSSASGERVYVNVEPHTGYAVADVSCYDESNHRNITVHKSGGQYYFDMPSGDASVYATFNEIYLTGND